jgi:hypothetical protein
MEELTKITKKQDLYKLIVTKELEQKIRYMCYRIPDKEWSGVLFYTTEGTFENNDLVVTCKDMYVMDIGNSTYTEFDVSPDVAGYMAQNMELFDCQHGLLHSHAGMQSFFSGTDVSTLREEGNDRNHFVSLIVNNAGVYTAGITRKVKLLREGFNNIVYKTFNNEEIKDRRHFKEEIEEIQWFELKIEVEKESNINEELDNRIKEIKDSKTTLKSFNNIPINPIKTFETTPKTPVNQTKMKFYEDLPFGEIVWEDHFIENIAKKIITGCMVLPSPEKIDIEKWANSMVNLYDTAFGKEGYTTPAFKYWAECYVETLCMEADYSKYKDLGFESEEMAALCAYDVIAYLELTVKSNKYLEAFIDYLSNIIL